MQASVSSCRLATGCMRLVRPQQVPSCTWSTRVGRIPLTGSLRCYAASKVSKGPEAPWDVKMLYDGDCPLCMREVNMLKRRDEGKGKIAFVDIASPAYDPRENEGISFESAMGNIHGILPDGRVITNVEVFRKLYEAVGLGWVYAITKIGPIGKAAEAVYGVWAKYRLPVTGRPDLATVLQQKKSCRIDEPANSQ